MVESVTVSLVLGIWRPIAHARGKPVKAKLVADRARNLVAVDVDTRDGVVHLQGSVRTEQDRMEAERLARRTTGVRDVKNDLRVDSRTSENRR